MQKSIFYAGLAVGVLLLLALPAILSEPAPDSADNSAGQSAESGATSADAASGDVAAPGARELLNLIPNDHMLAWYGRRMPNAPEPGSPSELGKFLNFASGVFGQSMSRNELINLRLLEMLGLMVRYDHALVMIDASAEQLRPDDPYAKRLSEVRVAIIIDTDGNSGPFHRIISGALTEQGSSNEFATLETREAHGHAYQHFHDSRLDDWQNVEYGDLDGYFVLTYGESVWPEIAATAAGVEPGVGRDDWLTSIRGDRGRNALIEIFVNAAKLNRDLDPLLNNNMTAFWNAWDAGAMQRAHWSLGLEDNALYCVSNLILDGKPVERIWANGATTDPDTLRVVEPAERYAIYEVNPAWAIPSFVRSLYVWQPPKERQGHYYTWRRVQQNLGINAQEDVLDQLGSEIVLHNFPPDPMQLPIFFTTMIKIDGDAQRVQAGLDKLCGAWQEKIQRDFDEKDITHPFRITQADDGIWYTFWWSFLPGPSWTTHEDYVIISWSPSALRQVLEDLASREPAVASRP